MRVNKAPRPGTGSRERASNNRPRGSDNPRWNPDKLIDSQGYELVRAGVGAPGADSNGYIRKQRVVASQKAGRPLHANEEAHHKNGQRADNRPGNIQPAKAAEHKGEHAKVRPRSKGKLK